MLHLNLMTGYPMETWAAVGRDTDRKAPIQLFRNGRNRCGVATLIPCHFGFVLLCIGGCIGKQAVRKKKGIQDQYSGPTKNGAHVLRVLMCCGQVLCVRMLLPDFARELQ